MVSHFTSSSFTSSDSNMVSTSLRISINIQCPRKDTILLSRPRSTTNLFLPRQPSPPSSVITFSRRRHSSSSSPITSKKHKEKQVLPDKNDDQGDDLDEDAFEALFCQLEEDLKNDDLSLNDDDDDISEEDLRKLEEELEEALKDDEILAAFGTSMDGQVEDEVEEEEEDEEHEEDEEVKDDDDEEGESPLKLKNWQLRRLAHALKKGRRKISIKNLAADVCLDRAVVLQLLREPPPNLLMMSAALPDEPASSILEPVATVMETIPLETATNETKPEVKEKVPVHVMQRNWSAQKRLKKGQLETLERVYRRTKRPTNAMISSIVHVTNLARKRVVKWFEDKRVEDGVPERHLPYQPTVPETAKML